MHQITRARPSTNTGSPSSLSEKYLCNLAFTPSTSWQTAATVITFYVCWMKSIYRKNASICLCTRKCFLYPSVSSNERWKGDSREISTDKTSRNPGVAATPSCSKFNLVGPRDYKSNIRKIIYAKPKDENTTEKRFREQQQDLNNWHQVFWEKQNEKFFKSKKAFLQLRSRDIETETNKDFADDLSRFYKNFLDGHYQVHSQYLRAWYLRNFQLLWSGLQVSTSRLIHKFIPWRPR